MKALFEMLNDNMYLLCLAPPLHHLALPLLSPDLHPHLAEDFHLHLKYIYIYNYSQSGQVQFIYKVGIDSKPIHTLV